MGVLVVIFGYIIFVLALSFLHDKKINRIALQRGSPNICKFARDFNYREVNTKIIRETFNSIQNWMPYPNCLSFPVEANDQFDSLYGMDPDDLNDILENVAKKLGISPQNIENNPYYDKIVSVKDAVLLLDWQQKQ